MKSVGRKNLLNFIVGELRSQVSNSIWYKSSSEQQQRNMRVVVEEVVETKKFGFIKSHVAKGYVTDGEMNFPFTAPISIGQLTLHTQS